MVGLLVGNSSSGGLSKGGEVFVSCSRLIGDDIQNEWSGGDGSDGFRSNDKIVVAVDVDEVVGDFVSVLNKFVAECYSLNHSVSEYHVYEFFKLTSEFMNSSKHHTSERGSIQSQVLRRQSRQNTIKDHTIEWIEEHFPGLFQEIHFGNHFSLDGKSKPKSEICKSLGAEILIDDNPKYAIECAELGINVLLFDYNDSYPWCKTVSVAQHP